MILSDKTKIVNE